MSQYDDLYALSDRFGIHNEFYDVTGKQRLTSDDTRRAFLAANGVDVSSEASISNALASSIAFEENRWFPQEVIVEAFQPSDMDFGLGAFWQVYVWGNEEPTAEGQAGDFIQLPALYPDVYNMRISVAGRVEYVRILVAPKRLANLDKKVWGITAALYGLQSATTKEVGDFSDLGALLKTAVKAGASFVGINPIHNMGFAETTAISPYSPSHRGFLNTDHIALYSIPGLNGLAPKKSKASLSDDLINYDIQRQNLRSELKLAYKEFQVKATDTATASFRSFEKDGGEQLQRFCRFEVFSELYGSNWHLWPEAAQNDAGSNINDCGFHAWLQWVADNQLKQAQGQHKTNLGLYLDLAVGSRRDGAESWCEREVIAQGVSVGAPPDQLGPNGQNWNLAAFSPQKLQAAGYAPFRQVLAQTMKHAGVVRIDHVLGLNRSFWIPDDGSAGAYISQPFESLLAIVKIEAYKANTLVIGEDLGLVPEGFRDVMQSHGFYGYSVLQYNKGHEGNFCDPKHGPSQVLSCFATHDTPTVSGFEQATDIDWWQKLGSFDKATSDHMRQQRAGDIQALLDLSPNVERDLTRSVNGALASANAQMVCLQLDDILGHIQAQNLPGTIDEHPNWQRKYQTEIEDLAAQKGMQMASEFMQACGR